MTRSMTGTSVRINDETMMASDTLQPVQELANTSSMQIPVMAQSASNA